MKVFFHSRSTRKLSAVEASGNSEDIYHRRDLLKIFSEKARIGGMIESFVHVRKRIHSGRVWTRMSLKSSRKTLPITNATQPCEVSQGGLYLSDCTPYGFAYGLLLTTEEGPTLVPSGINKRINDVLPICSLARRKSPTKAGPYQTNPRTIMSECIRVSQAANPAARLRLD